MKFSLEHYDADSFVGVHEVAKSDVDLVADHCAGLRGVQATGSKDMKHVARVPGFIVQKYINDNNITFAQFMRDPVHAERMLADPALKAFRVWEGRI